MANDIEEAIGDRARSSNAGNMTYAPPILITKDVDKGMGEEGAFSVFKISLTPFELETIVESATGWEVEGEDDISVINPSDTTEDIVRREAPSGTAQTPIVVVETLDAINLRVITSGAGPSVRIQKSL